MGTCSLNFGARVAKSQTLTMSQKLQDIFDGKTPYSWQLDAAEAIILGLGCVVFAGTGAGKTIPFMLPVTVRS